MSYGLLHWLSTVSPSISCRNDIGVDEIIAFEQQRFSGNFCVSEAVAKIQSGRMSAAFAEIAPAIRA
jgi:hypothetical protein